jgi:hypothetical protein
VLGMGNICWQHISILISVKSNPRMRLRTHEQVDGLCGLVIGCHTHKEE